MRLFATAALLMGLLAAPVSAQSPLLSRTHNTGTAGLRVFNTGVYGNSVGLAAFADTTFLFNGTGSGVLYEGQLLVGIGADSTSAQVSGQPYSDNPNNTSPNSGFDWSFGPRPSAVTPPAPFTQAFTTSYNDQGATNTSPNAISVSQRTLSRTGDDFVVVEVDVSSPLPRQNVYIGMFSDFDVSAAATADRGGFDAATRTVYTFNAGTGGNRNYYGVTLIGREQSGWSVSARTLTDQGLYAGLSQQRRRRGRPTATAG